MADSSAARNPGKGRRKIEIKKVEQPSKRLVTFSKRKLGLFRKAAELSLLCDSEIAVVVFSQQGKVFSTGYPNPDSVIRRYLSSTLASSSEPGHDLEGESAAVSSLRREYEEALKVLDDEKKSLKAAVVEIPARSGCGDGSWWNRPVGEMNLEEVVEYKERIEQLRKNLVAAAENKKEETAKALVVPLPPPTAEEEGLYMSMLNEDVGVVENDETWDWDWDWDLDLWNWNEGTSCDGSSSMVWNSDLGQSHEHPGL